MHTFYKTPLLYQLSVKKESKAWPLLSHRCHTAVLCFPCEVLSPSCYDSQVTLSLRTFRSDNLHLFATAVLYCPVLVQQYRNQPICAVWEFMEIENASVASPKMPRVRRPLHLLNHRFRWPLSMPRLDSHFTPLSTFSDSSLSLSGMFETSFCLVVPNFHH